MDTKKPSAVLDRTQLRDVTANDEDLMRQIMAALIEDTALQMDHLTTAIAQQDWIQCMRLAHYSKGACANVGAQTAAALLREIEAKASAANFGACSVALARLGEQLELLRSESRSL